MKRSKERDLDNQKDSVQNVNYYYINAWEQIIQEISSNSLDLNSKP